jgi:hypothetical protein
MHVWRVCLIGAIGGEITRELLPRNIAEGLRKLLTGRAIVAKRALIDLSIAWKAGRIQDRAISGNGARALHCDMLCARAVATLARNPKPQAGAADRAFA